MPAPSSARLVKVSAVRLLPPLPELSLSVSKLSLIILPLPVWFTKASSATALAYPQLVVHWRP